MPTTDRKLRVFLCHSSQDKPIVRELYQRLDAEGWIDPWLDEERLLPGQDWDLEIEKAVETADAVIVCLSNNSVTKEGYVQKELKKVLDIAEQKPEGTIFIIPVRLVECELPRSLKPYQWVDLYNAGASKLNLSLVLRAKQLGISVEKVFQSQVKILSKKRNKGEIQKVLVEDLLKNYSQNHVLFDNKRVNHELINVLKSQADEYPFADMFKNLDTFEIKDIRSDHYFRFTLEAQIEEKFRFKKSIITSSDVIKRKEAPFKSDNHDYVSKISADRRIFFEIPSEKVVDYEKIHHIDTIWESKPQSEPYQDVPFILSEVYAKEFLYSFYKSNLEIQNRGMKDNDSVQVLESMKEFVFKLPNFPNFSVHDPKLIEILKTDFRILIDATPFYNIRYRRTTKQTKGFIFKETLTVLVEGYINLCGSEKIRIFENKEWNA